MSGPDSLRELLGGAVIAFCCFAFYVAVVVGVAFAINALSR